MGEQATSTELTKFGVPMGHKNYAAAYCTGLLIARRMLKKFGMDGAFKGKEEIDGEDYHVEEEDNEQRPLKVILDVGLQTTCVGHRMWGALKGAVDGGLHLPHSNKLFPGYKPAEDKGAEAEYDAEAHKEKIFGTHVKEYMEMMQEEDPTKYEAHFAKFIENSIDADKVEDMYTEAHSKIRADPSFSAGDKKSVTYTRAGNKFTGSDGTDHVRSKKTGLLIARRMLKKFGLKVILDVGLQTTCVGHRMWGALKGAVDGGLHIPHNNKLFPGYKPAEDKGAEAEYDAEAH